MSLLVRNIMITMFGKIYNLCYRFIVCCMELCINYSSILFVEVLGKLKEGFL